jgi:gliding motility-associated-like protein
MSKFSFGLSANCQTIDFTFESSNGLFCNPSTILFTQTCTGNPTSFIWDFGNNTYSDQPSASVSYKTAGTYTVKLVAIFKNTTLQVSKTIVINPAVTANIGVDKNYICQPGTINFTGSGNGNITNYEWNFGDGTAVAGTSSNTISHAFASYANNNVTLKITDDKGCTGTKSIPVSIKKLPITGTVSPINGCIPAVSNFSANVTLPVNSTVTNYIWDFGDGSPLLNTAVKSTIHTYSLVGEYFPKLTINTSEGCTNTYNFNRLYFGTPPVNAVAYAKKDTFCGSETAVFVTKATNANRYYWDFGDGTNASTTDTIITHKYSTVGPKKIGVNSYFNECPGPYLTFQVMVIGVIAHYSRSNTCSNKNTYTFNDISSGKATSSLWDFGDSTQIANVVTAVHTFPIPGQFLATLSLVDSISGCTDKTSSTIYTASPNLYSTDSSICKYTAVNFSIENNYTNTAAQYTWHVAGNVVGPVPNAAITVNANQLGNFNNFVVINNGPGICLDTVNLNRNIIVKGPNLNFTAPSPLCLKSSLTITNNSAPYQPADSVNLWYWNFGNSIKNDSVYQPEPFQYAYPGSFAVQLTAIDKNGCKDSLAKIVTINPIPFLHITPLRDTLCYGDSVTLVAFHNNNLLWSPATNLTCSTCDTTIASPPVSTMYYATATNAYNCSVQDSSYIQVSIPFTATIVPNDIAICQQGTTTVDVNPKGKIILWTPATGLSNPSIYNPVISATQDVTYTATLSDSVGCITNSSSAIVKVHVKTLPTVDAGPDMIYPRGANFTLSPAYSNNVSSYLWKPSDLLSCNTCPSPNGINDITRNYVITVTSDSGCVASDSVRIAIECKDANLFMPKAFSPNNDNLNDYFYPITVGIKTIVRFTIYNRQGQVIYEATNFPPNDKTFGWNGLLKGSYQSVGTYVYILESICDIGEKLIKKGSFVLLR